MTHDLIDLTGLRFGKRRVTRMYAETNELRASIAAEGTPRIQDAWGDFEQHIDFAYQHAARGEQAERDRRELEAYRTGVQFIAAGADESARMAAQLEKRCAAIRAESGKEG